MGPYDRQSVRDAFAALGDSFVPPWSEPLRRCLTQSANDPASRFAALANVDSTGHPQVRHVVMRGCVGDIIGVLTSNAPWDFWMVTDRRSAKCSDLANLPQAEIAWYFRESREQFRFSGEISLVLESESVIRRAAFSRLSPAAKVQFLWPDPGQPRRPEQNVDFQVSLDPAGMSEPPDNFAILILSINAVDHLILDGTPQNRMVYGLNSIGGWKAVEVNP